MRCKKTGHIKVSAAGGRVMRLLARWTDTKYSIQMCAIECPACKATQITPVLRGDGWAEVCPIDDNRMHCQTVKACKGRKLFGAFCRDCHSLSMRPAELSRKKKSG